MRILVVPDAFKESCSAKAVAEAMIEGIIRVFPHAQIKSLPFTDGGDGALEVLNNTLGGTVVNVPTVNALGAPITAAYLRVDQHTAWISLAEASGLEQLSLEERNPRIASTYGTGLLIKHAIDHGCTKIRLSIGGSATNDAGMGIFCALGGKLLGHDKHPLPLGGEALQSLERIVTPHGMEHIDWEIICDVENPLLGPHGASHTYGPQKGADPKTVVQLERSLAHFASVVRQQMGKDITTLPGGGAAGGTGAGLAALFNACLRPGFAVMAEMIDLGKKIRAADVVFTAEGRMDQQSLHGKVPLGVAQLCQKNNRSCFGLAGSIDPAIIPQCYEKGFTGVFAIQMGPLPLEESISKAEILLANTAENACRMFQKIRSQ